VSNNQISFHARSRVVEEIVMRLRLPSNEKGFKNDQDDTYCVPSGVNTIQARGLGKGYLGGMIIPVRP